MFFLVSIKTKTQMHVWFPANLLLLQDHLLLSLMLDNAEEKQTS